MKSNGEIDALRGEELAMLERWTDAEGRPNDEVCALLKERFGATVTAEDLEAWKQWRKDEQARQETSRRVAESAEATNQLIREYRENPDNAYERVLEVIGQKTFDLLMNKEEPQLDTLANMAKLVVSVQGHRLKEREQKFVELKYQDERAEKSAEENQEGKKGITPDTREGIRTGINLF